MISHARTASRNLSFVAASFRKECSLRKLAATFMTVALASASAHALNGAVKNSAGYAATDAVAFFKSDTNTRVTIGGAGAFALAAPTAVAPGATAARRDRIALSDGRLMVTLSAPAREVSLDIFTTEGARRFEIKPSPLGGGAHHLDLPRLAPGLYSVRLTADGQSAAARVIHAGEGAGARRVSMVRSGERAAASASPSTPLAKIAAVDTLIVRKSGYLTARVPVTSYTQTNLQIVLAADTAAALATVADYSVDGPFATVVETNVGPGGNYTIIRPATLGANGFLHAPIIYGHGINAQVSGFTTFLRGVASHGFVIIARNVLTGGPNNAANTAAMNDGLNWILAQDTTTGSLYRGKLATDRAASMGYSVGGTAAVDIGAHLALKTVVSIHGHISSATLRGTLLQTSGTLDNVGLPMQQTTFANSVVPTFLGTVTGANHGYIQNNNGGVQRPAIIAWLRLQIYNDQGAANHFHGNACVLCTAPWENPQRKNWN